MLDIDDIIKETLEELLNRMDVDYSKILIDEDEEGTFHVNIKTDHPSILIGYHGLNVQAIQHVLKVLCWKKTNDAKYNIYLDVDDYKKRQEENVIKLAERKIEAVRDNGRPQHLPPMSPYFRRKIHTLCMNAGYEDLETLSEGENDRRHVIIKLKN